MNYLSPMNVSKRFLKLFKVGADTMNSGNAFQSEITRNEKKCLRISFLRHFFLNLN